MLSWHGMIALSGVPCPLAIFTLALLSAAMPCVDNIIVFMLLAWVLVNIPKIFWHVGCYEEIILILAGAYVLGLNRIMPEKNIGDEHASTWALIKTEVRSYPTLHSETACRMCGRRKRLLPVPTRGTWTMYRVLTATRWRRMPLPLGRIVHFVSQPMGER